MPRSHAPYPAQFRRQMVELVAVGRNPEELSKEFQVSGQAIRNWVRQARLDSRKRKDGLTSVEREELTRLRRENRQLKMERESLAKAASWLARDKPFEEPTKESRFTEEQMAAILREGGGWAEDAEMERHSRRPAAVNDGSAPAAGACRPRRRCAATQALRASRTHNAGNGRSRRVSYLVSPSPSPHRAPAS